MRRLTGIPRQRLATHGDFKESACVAQFIKAAVAAHWRWERLEPEHREALQMIAFKMARIVTGDPDHGDHWDDIAGYAQLGRRACARRRGRAR